jgi:phage baseplate assembly protein W
VTAHVGFPFRPDARGRTTSPVQARHVRELVEQLLFTAPGERVNRPSFGSGLLQLVHEPAADELAAATQLLVQGSLQQWLADVIEVQSVEVRGQESLLEITVRYSVRETGERRAETFRRSAS